LQNKSGVDQIPIRIEKENDVTRSDQFDLKKPVNEEMNKISQHSAFESNFDQNFTKKN
jgi:hypothetical protein